MIGDTFPDPTPPAGEDPAGDPSSARREIANLVKEYFNVCNAALAHGTDGALEHTLLNLLNQFASGDTIVLAVTGTGEAEPPTYTTRFIDGQFTPISEGAHDPEAHFSLDREFLETVSRDAEQFIAHPTRLDWSWVVHRD